MTALLLIAQLFAPRLPAPTITPGMANPLVTDDNIGRTICKSGWTRTVRPPVGYTSQLKRQQMAERGLNGTAKDYEEDHLIPLELGGHPTDPNNLWPQPWKGQCNAHDKDRLENVLHRKVCNFSVTLDEARAAIVGDWVTAYHIYVGPLACE